MTNYIFKKEWTEKEHKTIIKKFSNWERKNLIIVYGDRDITTEYTYGLPYTSSSGFAMISNTNVQAVLKEDKNLCFNWLALSINNEIIAGFTDNNENEKLIKIGEI